MTLKTVECLLFPFCPALVTGNAFNSAFDVSMTHDMIPDYTLLDALSNTVVLMAVFDDDQHYCQQRKPS